MSNQPQSRSCKLPITSLSLPFGDGLEALWLGQSGFLLSTGRELILLDAYLSNFLVDHADEIPLPYSHERMLAPPIEDSVLPMVDFVLITHGHEDHLDPDLIRRMATSCPKTRYIIPPGCAEAMRALGVSAENLEIVDYQTPKQISPTFTLEAFPSAHPTPEFDSSKTWALSYSLNLCGKSLFFAGDTTPYPELSAWLKKRPFDLLILPTNGRTAELEANGIVGNMSFEEALILSSLLETPLLATHFGMFAFNTLDLSEAKKTVGNLGMESQVSFTEAGVVYSF